MPSTPTISIALCTCNGERFVLEQLESIVAQTLLPWELVISDDCSTDATLKIVESFASRAPFLVRIYRNAERLGVAGNFESAMRHCQGEIICLADQDDRWEPHKLARIVEEFSRKPGLGLVFSDGSLIDGSGTPIPGSLWESAGFRPDSTLSENGFFARLMRGPVATGATMAISAPFRDRITPIDREWIHDEWMLLLGAGGAGEVTWIPEKLIAYRKHATQVVGVKSGGMISGIQAASVQPSPFEKLEKQFASIHEFATSHLSSRIPADRLFMLQEKSTSAGKRARIMKSGRLSRIPQVGMLFLRGQYGRFWLGWKSAMRDLLL